MTAEERVWWAVAAGALLLAVLVVVIPPFQAADENRHFFRAWQISEGQILPDWRPPAAVDSDETHTFQTPVGGLLPVGIDHVLKAVDARRLRFHADQQVSVCRLADAFDVRLDAHRRLFFRFPHNAAYAPWPYLPQALAYAASRQVSDRPLVAFYAGRVINAALAFALFAWAWRVAPALRTPLAALFLVPVVGFQMASLSPDALIIGAAALYTVLCIPALDPGGRCRWGLRLPLAWLFMAKPVYGPLLLLALLDHRHGRGRAVAGIVLACLPQIAWMVASRPVAVPFRMDRNLDPLAQLAGLAAEPMRVFEVLVATVEERTWQYVESMVGVLGWLDYSIGPGWILAVYGVLILAVVAAGGVGAPRWQGGLALGLVAVSVAGTLAAAYLMFTTVGQATVGGVQGRYFLPLLPAVFAGVVLWRRREAWPPWGRGAVVAGALVIWGVALAATLERYYRAC